MTVGLRGNRDSRLPLRMLGASRRSPHRAKYPNRRVYGTWVILCRPLQEVVLVGVGGGGRARGYAQLGEDVAHVAGHGLLAEEQVSGDRVVGLARRHETEH